MATSLGITGTGLARAVAIAAQVVLGAALIALVAGSRWLADPLGVVTFALGAGGLVAGTAIWWRTGRPALLLVANAWFVAYALALFRIEATSTVSDLESSLYDPAYWQGLHDLGGPQLTVGVIWFAVGLVGLIAIGRSRAAEPPDD